LDNCYRPFVELTGDIAATLNGLNSRIDRSKASDLASKILKAIEFERTELSREVATRNGSPIHPLRLVAELQPFLSSDMTICLDMGSALGDRGLDRAPFREGPFNLWGWRLSVFRDGVRNGCQAQGEHRSSCLD